MVPLAQLVPPPSAPPVLVLAGLDGSSGFAGSSGPACSWLASSAPSAPPILLRPRRPRVFLAGPARARPAPSVLRWSTLFRAASAQAVLSCPVLVSPAGGLDLGGARPAQG